jgi:hypothetical protein
MRNTKDQEMRLELVGSFMLLRLAIFSTWNTIDNVLVMEVSIQDRLFPVNVLPLATFDVFDVLPELVFIEV